MPDFQAVVAGGGEGEVGGGGERGGGAKARGLRVGGYSDELPPLSRPIVELRHASAFIGQMESGPRPTVLPKLVGAVGAGAHCGCAAGEPGGEQDAGALVDLLDINTAISKNSSCAAIRE